MKRIMWLCNTPLPEMWGELGLKVCGEGWLQGISNQLRRREDIELHYVFPQGKYRKILCRQIDHITFWGFYSNSERGYEISQNRKRLIGKIVKEIKPNIIHIFGTEFAHTLECMQVVSNEMPVIVSTQGIISELAKAYTKGIPIKNQLSGLESSHSILNGKYEFYRRGRNERELLRAVKNVMGRTAWDKWCVRKLNPTCKYFYCNETLRESFYEGKWEIDKIEKYSIYISQANYPIKGFHIFLKAFSEIIKSFPDARVYVAGSRLFIDEENAYGRYVNKLIDQYRIRKHIRFLGILSAEEVKKRLLNVHVAVMPSLLENSPNSVGEAMLLGTPIVAAQVGGIPSLVRNEREALLYADHNAKQLAECVRHIFTDHKLAQKLSGNERHRARKLYDKTANLEQLLRIYEMIGKEPV